MPSAPTPDARHSPCVVCGKPATAGHAPFCGQGCKDRDLLQWLSAGHRIPGPATDEEEADGLDSSSDGT